MTYHIIEVFKKKYGRMGIKVRNLTIISICICYFLNILPSTLIQNRTSAQNYNLFNADAPISIYNNTQLASYSTQGDGTQSTPYIIENLKIDGALSSGCLLIQDTTAYFVLRECEFYNGQFGIRLDNVQNGYLMNNLIYNNRWGTGGGIYIEHSSDNTVFNNTLSNNSNYGISLEFSSSTLVLNNTLTDHNHGIFTYHADNNELTNNTFFDNGITLGWSTNNQIFSNQIYDSQIAFMASDLADYTHQITPDNKRNGKSIYYFQYQSGMTVPTDGAQVILVACAFITVSGCVLPGGLTAHSTDQSTFSNNIANGIALVQSSNNEISGNNVTNSDWTGIHLSRYSDDNQIINNTANGNYHGISCSFADNNIIANNTAKNNEMYGISLTSSCSNNDIINNTANFNAVGIIIYPGSDSDLSRSDYNSIINNTANNNNYGIALWRFCPNNDVINNTANFNTYYGIELRYIGASSPSDTNLINNSVNFNTKGIGIISSHSNTASFNTVKNNSDTGIYLENSNFNTITWNILEGNTQCISEVGCTGNVIQNNGCPDPTDNGDGNGSPDDYFIWFLLLIGIAVIGASVFLVHRRLQTPTSVPSEPKTPTSMPSKPKTPTSVPSKPTTPIEKQSVVSEFHCSGCGKRNEPGSIFCKNCGHELFERK